MNIRDYESLPDGMDKDEVEKIFYIWLNETEQDSFETALNKLEILNNVQWHTSELPSKNVSQLLTSWINSNTSENNEHIDIMLGAAYCFGLSKKLYKSLLDKLEGWSKCEAQSDLDNSVENGDFIDPYWTLRDGFKKDKIKGVKGRELDKI